MLKFFKISCHFSAIYVKNHFNDVNKGVDSIGDWIFDHNFVKKIAYE